VLNEDLSIVPREAEENQTTAGSLVVDGAPAQPPPFHVALLRAAQKLLRHHPALALTLGYLFLTAVGMTYEWMFFSSFNVLIFNFAEPSDFLLVAVREPVLLLFTVISVLVLVRVTNKHSKRLGRAGRYQRIYLWLQAKRWWRLVERLCYVGLVIGYFMSLTSTYAGYRAEQVHNGHGNKVRVELVGEGGAKPGETGGKEFLLLGSTSKYLLVYDPATKTTQVLSANNISRVITRP